MKVIICKCRPYSTFHLGQNSLEDSFEIIHSDTLFSALVNMYALLYPSGEVDDLIAQVKEGKLRLSSAYHCLQYERGAPDQDIVGKYLFFLPKPLLPYEGSEDDIKQFKKIEYISAGIWELGPGMLELMIPPRLGGKHALTYDELLDMGLDENQLLIGQGIEDLKLVRTIVHPKVKVHSYGQDDTFFHRTSIQICPIQTKSGSIRPHFYFLLDEELDPTSSKRIMTAIRLLADEGIGGERSSGCGHFEGIEVHEYSTMNLPAFESQGIPCTLSLGIPDEGEFDKFEAYRLLIRGGGTVGRLGEKTFHRRQIRMIAEGARLKNDAPEVRGKLANLAPEVEKEGVSPPNPIYRNGLIISLPYQHA